MGHCKLAGPTVWRSAGLLAACLAAVFLLRLPVLSASGSSGLSESGGSGSGAEEDAPGSADIRTPDGSYALTGEVLAQLPPDSVQLGVLFQEGADSRTGLYAARREHAGCILWAAPGGGTCTSSCPAADMPGPARSRDNAQWLHFSSGAGIMLTNAPEEVALWPKNWNMNPSPRSPGPNSRKRGLPRRTAPSRRRRKRSPRRICFTGSTP
ncbi:MAG: hypothetical protein ACLR0P_01355 [Oscillospiraceae bacterium]